MAHDCQYAPDVFIRFSGFQSCPRIYLPPASVFDEYGYKKVQTRFQRDRKRKYGMPTPANNYCSTGKQMREFLQATLKLGGCPLISNRIQTGLNPENYARSGICRRQPIANPHPFDCNLTSHKLWTNVKE
jgi:hypothetical protein